MSMEIQYWPINQELKKEAEENYRTNFALSLKDKDPLSIIRELTFDGVTPEMTVEKIERLFDYVERNFLKKPIAGVGVEVGAGPLTFSSILAKRSGIQKMYGVEICQPIVETLFPKVSQYVLNGNSDKVVGVVGSFDEMQLPDNSVDFVFDFFSLHHSLDIAVTIKELHRVLKPGGFVLCFDKARPNRYTDAELDELLDSVYGSSYNKQFGLSPDVRMTRRLNGEREYRLNDWKTTFLGAGFTKFDDAYLARTIGGTNVAHVIKKVIAFFPPLLQRVVNPLLPQPRFSHKFILESHNRNFTPPVDSFAKEISLMVAYK
ncbi:MAG: class I SAM-dependent methyltransferase [Candidatus Yanofskybacteria bacterium]|nr:class I SAM-dependent methyltransferase [Candidatus Yanofskybacteria bacterium]